MTNLEKSKIPLALTKLSMQASHPDYTGSLRSQPISPFAPQKPQPLTPHNFKAPYGSTDLQRLLILHVIPRIPVGLTLSVLPSFHPPQALKASSFLWLLVSFVAPFSKYNVTNAYVIKTAKVKHKLVDLGCIALVFQKYLKNSVKT